MNRKGMVVGDISIATACRQCQIRAWRYIFLCMTNMLDR
jgi:hypothetical protein